MINDTTLIVLTICAVLWIYMLILQYVYAKQLEAAREKERAAKEGE